MMYSLDVRVDLSKDRRPVFYYFHSPAEEAKWSLFYVLREGELCSGKNADGCCTVIR
jgi:hypothetical protein